MSQSPRKARNAGIAHRAPGIRFPEGEDEKDEEKGEQAAPEHLLERARPLEVAGDDPGGAPQHRGRDHQGYRRRARNGESASAVWPLLMPSGGPW